MKANLSKKHDQIGQEIGDRIMQLAEKRKLARVDSLTEFKAQKKKNAIKRQMAISVIDENRPSPENDFDRLRFFQNTDRPSEDCIQFHDFNQRAFPNLIGFRKHIESREETQKRLINSFQQQSLTALVYEEIDLNYQHKIDEIRENFQEKKGENDAYLSSLKMLRKIGLEAVGLYHSAAVINADGSKKEGYEDHFVSRPQMQILHNSMYENVDWQLMLELLFDLEKT